MSLTQKFLSNFRSFLINTSVWIFIVIVYGPFLLILSGWRYFVNWLAVRLDPDLIPCSSNDTLLVHETPDKQPILTGGFVLRVKGSIDVIKLRTLFEELFLSKDEPSQQDNYQNLYCDLVKFCGYLFKRKIVRRIKLENHLMVKDLKDGEDFKVNVSSWFQEKFQKGLPLWQMLVLNGENSENVNSVTSYFAFKAHHVLMDGYSLVHILDKLTGVTSPGEWTSDDDRKCVKCEGKSLWTELKILFSIPEVVAGFTFPNVSLKDSKKFPDSKPLSNFEMLPMACATTALQPIKEVRRKLKVHFPAIVFGLQAGVIREALMDGCGSSPVAESQLPENILICSSLPVVGVEHPRNKLTNHWSGGYIKVPLKQSSAKLRVEEANSSVENVLRNEGTYIIWKYMAFLMWLVPPWFHWFLANCRVFQLCKYRSSMSCIPQSCTVQYNLMGLPVQNIFHAPIMKDSFFTAGKGNPKMYIL